MTEQMPPGRELDAAVAAVLGLEYRQSEPWERWDEPPAIRWVVEIKPSVICEWVPSRTWAAAGLVVERLIADGWDVKILYHQSYESYGRSGWVVSLSSLKRGGQRGCYGESAPHAISLAALAALADGDCCSPLEAADV